MNHIGLCEGRHEIKTNEGESVNDFVFHMVENPLDFDSHETVVNKWLNGRKAMLTSLSRSDEPLYLYVTGLTSLLVAFLNQWNHLQRLSNSPLPSLVLMHYDRDSEQYQPQKTICQTWVAY